MNNILQLSLLQNSGCAGGCKFCGLSIDSEVNRETKITKVEFERAFEDARVQDARLELVFAYVGANERKVLNLITEMHPVIQANNDIELAINPGVCTKPNFYKRLTELGIHRYRNNLECSRRLFRELVPKNPLIQEIKLISLDLARQAGMKVDTGWLCGLGEQKEDIKDIFELISHSSPDSITLNFFDPQESAEAFNHTQPSIERGLHCLEMLRKKFPDTELTLGGAHELWLGSEANIKSRVNVEGQYVGRFLDHGLREEASQVKSGKHNTC